ncbi:MAG TPA: type II toxin-antitoxin system prevent-host-death family antitoxin [Terriglobia bacterium]|nr:type II toxin-antitoxin system prevent-host-death family antitoxin [Terriglobia bacterium]
MKTKARTLTATEFKAKCLRILDNLGSEGVTVTKRGRAVARVTPVSATDHEKFYGSMKGKIKIKGDIFSTGIKWNAES